MNSFTIYRDYIDLISLLPNRKEQSELIFAICNYMFFDEEPNLNSNQMKVFRNLKRPLDKSKKRGVCGSSTKSNENQNKIKKESNENQKENKTETHQDVYVYVNDNVKEDSNNRGMGEEEEEETTTDDTGLLAEIVEKVISYLNTKTGSKYRTSTKTTRQHINARLNEGYGLDDFKTVIDKKYIEWESTEFEKYLCPETLFGTKFEKYLNQKVIKKQSVKREKEVPIWFDKKIEEEDESEEERRELEAIINGTYRA